MNRAVLLGLLTLSFCFPLLADDKEKKETKAPEAVGEQASGVSAADALKASPNDSLAWRKYLTEQLPGLMQLVDSKPEEAKKKLDEIRAFVEGIKPSEPSGEGSARTAKATLDAYEEIIQLSKVTVEELAKELKASPDDVKVIRKLGSKMMRTIGMQARSEPDKAEAQLKEVKAALTSAREAATSDEAKKAYESTSRMITTLERTIESSKKLAALVGQDAAPLKVEAWVNGEALTDADLKGKVVLLDFWAIWCGPCIATFPHLKEWNEKYEKKGLVMIGLTNYYGFEWDEKAERAKKAAGEVTHEQEHEMLKKFAEHYELKHRFGVQTDRSTAEFYAVTGIPHVVVIDQAGKIRLIRVGSGPANAKDISDMLEKLLGEPKVANN